MPFEKQYVVERGKRGAGSWELGVVLTDRLILKAMVPEGDNRIGLASIHFK